jgi:hypothetical protein
MQQLATDEDEQSAIHQAISQLEQTDKAIMHYCTLKAIRACTQVFSWPEACFLGYVST